MRYLMLLLLSLCNLFSLHADETAVWIGTASSKNGESKGIYRTVLNTESGKLTKPALAAEIGSPGFLSIRPDGRRLYSLCSLPNGGGVAAFEIDASATSLSLLNTQPIGDGGGTHLSLDKTNRLLFTAQYGAGSTAIFPLSESGKIEPRSDLVRHDGSGPNKQRQQRPHPHWTGVSPDNQFLFVPDLGADQVVIYAIDHSAGKIRPNGFGKSPPGSGPRHMKFHGSGKWIYVLNELDMSVTAFDYEAQQGRMESTQTIATLPKSMQERRNSASEIRIHPTGEFIYTANRGHDSITVFSINQRTGKLQFIEREAVRGSWPRNFNIDASGRWLIAAGRHSNTLSVFEIDSKTGGLVYTGNTVNCPTPICVEFQP